MIRQRNLQRVPSGSFNERGSRKESEKRSSYPVSFWVLLLAFFAAVGGCFVLYTRNSSELSNLEKIATKSRFTVEELTERVLALNNKKNELTKALETEAMEKDQLRARAENLETKMKSLLSKQERLKKRAEGKIVEQRENLELTLAQERWGKGDVFVDFQTDHGNFRMKMASFETMPHTTSWFLTLAELGYWTRCGFIRNADHVLQANCKPKMETGGDNQASVNIAFQEYNEAYTHKKYTFGIAGRPGGPDWYINLSDNIRNHGPGGQGVEADPCFAELVSGAEVIEAIHKLEHDGTSYKGLVNPVIFNDVQVMRGPAVVDKGVKDVRKRDRKLMSKSL